MIINCIHTFLRLALEHMLIGKSVGEEDEV